MSRFLPFVRFVSSLVNEYSRKPPHGAITDLALSLDLAAESLLSVADSLRSFVDKPNLFLFTTGMIELQLFLYNYLHL
jgi:hypothetical protein